MIYPGTEAHPGGAAAQGSAAAEWRGALAFGGLNVAVSIIGLACLYPFYLATSGSLRTLAALVGLAHWPDTPRAQQWALLLADIFSPTVFAHHGVALALSVMVVLVTLFLGVTAHYAFGNVPSRGRLRTLAVVGSTLLPQVAVLSSMFEHARTVHLYNHWWGLTLPYLVFTLPFAVWAVMACAGRLQGLLRWPRGASDRLFADFVLRALWPSLKPSLLVTSLVAFIAAWNEFMFSVTFVLDSTQRLPPMLTALPEIASWLEDSPGKVGGAVALAAFVVAATGVALWRKKVSGSRPARRESA